MRSADVERRWMEFAEFYTACRDDCLRVVMVNVGNRQLAEDLVAEAFTRALMSWRKVSRHPSPKGWVVRTALNTSVSWWRRNRREIPADGIEAFGVPDQYPGMDATTVVALRRLPKRQREVVILRILLDLDTATTATTLGIALELGGRQRRSQPVARGRLRAQPEGRTRQRHQVVELALITRRDAVRRVGAAELELLSL
jgi:RNA polymerase sigma factor (sigma-70 family)